MKFDVVRAWKDEAYRQSLGQEQRAQLPTNPSGEADLTDADLQTIYGGDLGWGGALAGASAFNNGGFGFGNFNKAVISRSCSHNCSFGCDIRQDF
jgi:mersacidin/lichenicidin family type 2 lantibiotic